MKRGTQKKIAQKVNVSDAYISQILSGKRNISKTVAKRLSETTGVSPLVWLYGSPDEFKQLFSDYFND